MHALMPQLLQAYKGFLLVFATTRTHQRAFEPFAEGGHQKKVLPNKRSTGNKCSGSHNCYTRIYKNVAGCIRQRKGCSSNCEPTAKWESVKCCKGDWCNHLDHVSVNSVSVLSPLNLCVIIFMSFVPLFC